MTKEAIRYNSKVDWWIPALGTLTVVMCFAGPLIDGEGLPVSLIMAAFLLILEGVMFGSVKYQICDGKLGVRNIFYRWEWFPIDKMSEIRKTRGFLSGPCLSARRIAISFCDRKILKSSMPMEISPKDRDHFITLLKDINPAIEVK